MNDLPLLGVGIDGAAFAALCCFTPVFVVLSLWCWRARLAYPQSPATLTMSCCPRRCFFIGLTVYAVWRRQRRLTRS